MYSILTKREREVYELLIHNHSTKEIAKRLGISDKTVRNHISNVMLKLGVKGRAQAVVDCCDTRYLRVTSKSCFSLCNNRICV